MKLLGILKKFLIEHAVSGEPLLLGLSGGPDSMVLFYALLELKIKENLDFAVAHVNHNWREISGFEALELKKIVEDAGLLFHLLELDPNLLSGNLENSCREKRLEFFKELCSTFGYRGVLLGHHADDQAETVLKRVLEGAILPRLHGLKQVNRINGLTIFRPLLLLRKSEIKKWLIEKKIEAFEDQTNHDPKFLRGRFRTKILPYLNAQFGKEVTMPLYRLGTQSLELNQYLEQNILTHLQKIERGTDFSSYDFSSIMMPFEIKYLVRSFAESEGISLSYSLVDKAAFFIQTNALNKTIFMQGRKIHFNRKKMVIWYVIKG